MATLDQAPGRNPATLAFEPLLCVAPTGRWTRAAGPCRHRPAFVHRRPAVTGVWPAHHALPLLPLTRHSLSLSFGLWARRRECGVAQPGRRRPGGSTPPASLLPSVVGVTGSGVVASPPARASPPPCRSSLRWGWGCGVPSSARRQPNAGPPFPAVDQSRGSKKPPPVVLPFLPKIRGLRPLW